MSEYRLPRWAPWPIGVILVIAAWFVALVTPGEERVTSPFPVTAAVGDEGAGRNIAVTVTDMHRAAEVTAGGWSAEGNWLVVDLDVASVVSESGTLLSHLELVVDGVRYGASERPESLRRAGLSAGIPRSGSLAFELPEDLIDGDAVLELAIDGDTRLDSMIVVPFDLADVPDVGAAELTETKWTNP